MHAPPKIALWSLDSRPPVSHGVDAVLGHLSVSSKGARPWAVVGSDDLVSVDLDVASQTCGHDVDGLVQCESNVVFVLVQQEHFGQGVDVVLYDVAVDLMLQWQRLAGLGGLASHLRFPSGFRSLSRPLYLHSRFYLLVFQVVF